MKNKIKNSNRAFIAGACVMMISAVGCSKDPSDPKWGSVSTSKQCLLGNNDQRCILKVFKERNQKMAHFAKIYQNERIWRFHCVRWCPHMTIERCNYIYQVSRGMCVASDTSSRVQTRTPPDNQTPSIALTPERTVEKAVTPQGGNQLHAGPVVPRMEHQLQGVNPPKAGGGNIAPRVLNNDRRN
jgi:hypothetical protein